MEPLLPVLLALPLGVAALIVALSSVRRHRRARVHGPGEPVHRAQAAPAAVQASVVHPPAAQRKVEGGRARRGRAGTR